ncbi:MAG: hypothetical protein ABI640_18705 [Gammaproteobacteria bacterium]
MQAPGGLAIVPSYLFGREPRIDVLIVPGGLVTDEFFPTGGADLSSTTKRAVDRQRSTARLHH